jgi:hypothetical protein
LRKALIWSILESNPYQMKTVILAIIVVACSVDLSAQGVFSNATNTALEKVIQDYPNQFRNIKGEVLIQNAQATAFESSVKIPGSISCIVSQSNSSRQAMSWKAELLTSSNFSEASAKYTDLYNQIKNTIIKIQGSKPYILSGQYAAPEKSKSYQAVIFNMLPASGELQKIKVEVSLEQAGSNWKLQLSIYDDSEQQLVRNQ